MVEENIKRIQLQIEEACKKINKNPEDIIIVAVTKTFNSLLARKAFQAGIHNLAENYVQEMTKKMNELVDLPIRWHFIGHVQSNKVKYIAGKVDFIHSVDSVKLAKIISDQALKAKRKQKILLEVNTSGEATKFGFRPEEVQEAAMEIQSFEGIDLQGLMTIGKFSDNPEDSRREFKLLKEIQKQLENNGLNLKHLSMGMSNDFLVAIEEGATMVRLGTAIFGHRNYNKN